MLIKITEYIVTLLLLLLGIAHTALTPMFYKEFDLNSLWFSGVGLGFVFLGLLNLSRINTTEMMTKKMALIGNFIALIYSVLLVIKLGKPQTFVSLAVLLTLFSLSVFAVKRESKI
ncbi:MAG: hypothetical protein GY787_16075 [Alteromonadales bacterium]|nr:hypothetical protein [Alteromonadales bacterium]